MAWQNRRISKLNKSFDQQISSHFFVDTPKKKKETLFAQAWERVEKLFTRGFGIWRSRGPIINHFFVAAIEPERFSRKAPFLFRSEEHRRGIAQNPVFAPRPVKQFLDVLERVSALEPRIEHAVRKNKVRCRRAGQRPPDAEAAVLPDAVDDDGVVFRTPLFYPIRKAGRVSVTSEPGTERVDGNGGAAHPWIGRRIQRNNFHLVSATKQSGG